MKSISLLICLFFLTACNNQTTKNTQNTNNNSLTSNSAEISCYKEANEDLLSYECLLLNNTFHGTIGDDNRRIDIRFLSLLLKEKSSNTYRVTGKSKVRNNICDFSGELHMNLKLLQDSDACQDPDNSYGILYGTYELKEDAAQKHAGTFAGDFSIHFEKGTSEYDSSDPPLFPYDITTPSIFSDVWTSYANNTKYCSWGYRIPPSKNNNLTRYFENGEYHFNTKYLNDEWKSYAIVHFSVPRNFEKDENFYSEDFLHFSEEEVASSRQAENFEWWK